MLLTSKQVEEFLDDGVLVVENILSEEEILQSLQGLKQTLANNGVRSFDIDDEDSARAFNKLSSVSHNCPLCRPGKAYAFVVAHTS